MTFELSKNALLILYKALLNSFIGFLAISAQSFISIGTHLSASASTVVEEDGFSLVCAASKFRFSNVSWRHSDNGLFGLDNEILIDYWDTNYSHWSNISIRTSQRGKHSGKYYCIAQRFGLLLCTLG